MFTKFVVSTVLIISGACAAVHAQQPQIPTLQVCNATQVEGSATVKIAKRTDALHSGTFKIKINLKCDSVNQPYPTGALDIFSISMSDSSVQGTITGTSFEQVTTTGKHTPTVYINGRCKAEQVKGCRFWLMIADNTTSPAGGTPDIVSFLVFDGTGKRVAYGTGPVTTGDIDVQDTGN